MQPASRAVAGRPVRAQRPPLDVCRFDPTSAATARPSEYRGRPTARNRVRRQHRCPDRKGWIGTGRRRSCSPPNRKRPSFARPASPCRPAPLADLPSRGSLSRRRPNHPRGRPGRRTKDPHRPLGARRRHPLRRILGRPRREEPTPRRGSPHPGRAAAGVRRPVRVLTSPPRRTGAAAAGGKTDRPSGICDPTAPGAKSSDGRAGHTGPLSGPGPCQCTRRMPCPFLPACRATATDAAHATRFACVSTAAPARRRRAALMFLRGNWPRRFLEDERAA